MWRNDFPQVEDDITIQGLEITTNTKKGCNYVLLMDKLHYDKNWVLGYQWKLENCKLLQYKGIYGFLFKLNYSFWHEITK